MRCSFKVLSCFLITLALCSTGQLISPGNYHRLIGNPGVSIPTPDAIPKMYVWWVASDVPVGATVTNQWLDRKRSIPLSSTSDVTSPTNSALGVFITTGLYLTNNISLYTGNPQVAFAAIFIPVVESIGDGMIWGNSGSGQGFFHSSADKPSAWATISGQSEGPVVPNGVPCDVIFYQLNDYSYSYYYQNGVAIKTNSTTGAPDQMGVDRVGSMALGNQFIGYIMELFCYTNELTAADAIAIHRYRTNKYGGSP